MKAMPLTLVIGFAANLILSFRPSIGTENPVPKKVDYREISIRVAVMYKVKLLLASEPRKPMKPRSVNVVFLIEKDVRVE